MSARPMKVLQVIPQLETGGAERTTVDIAAAVVEEGGEALVVSAGGRMVAELEAVGGRHVTMPAAAKSPVAIARNARRMAALIAREGVDIVHARSRAPAWSAFRAARRTGRPFVTTYHGAYNEASRLKNLYNSVMARGDAVIANSAYTADLIAARHPFAAPRIVTIHRGVDLTRFAEDASARGEAMRQAWGIEPGRPVLVNIARLTPWKGQEVLIEALGRLAADASALDAVCVLAGDAQGRTDYRQKLERQAAALGVADRVRIVGHVDDVPGALAAATVGVQPSIEPEAFGRAAVEVQAAGLPVVVADLGAVRETVLAAPEAGEAERTGWRVPPGDATALAAALAEALAMSPAERAAMGRRGQMHAHANFSLSAMKTKTLRVYHSLLEDRVCALY